MRYHGNEFTEYLCNGCINNLIVDCSGEVGWLNFETTFGIRLTTADIHCTLYFKTCEIGEDLIIENSIICQDLRIRESTITGDLNLRDTEIRMDLDLRETKVKGNLHLENLKVNGEIKLDKIVVDGEIFCNDPAIALQLFLYFGNKVHLTTSSIRRLFQNFSQLKI